LPVNWGSWGDGDGDVLQLRPVVADARHDEGLVVQGDLDRIVHDQHLALGLLR
jgi:hypothetical protein